MHCILHSFKAERITVTGNIRLASPHPASHCPPSTLAHATIRQDLAFTGRNFCLVHGKNNRPQYLWYNRMHEKEPKIW